MELNWNPFPSIENIRKQLAICKKLKSILFKGFSADNINEAKESVQTAGISGLATTAALSMIKSTDLVFSKQKEEYAFFIGYSMRG